MKSILATLLLGVTIATLTGCSAKSDMAVTGDRFHSYENMIDVRLEGATEGTLTEVFGKVVNSAPTVVSAKRYSTNIVPDNPQACWLLWRVEIGEGDGFQLQTDMMDMFREIDRAGGYLEMYGIPYRYSSSEIDLLKGIRPSDATSRALWFVVDRELARDKEMAK